MDIDSKFNSRGVVIIAIAAVLLGLMVVQTQFKFRQVAEQVASLHAKDVLLEKKDKEQQDQIDELKQRIAALTPPSSAPAKDKK